MEKLRVGILGTGTIAARMAETLQQMDSATLCAVGSRTMEHALQFATAYDVPAAYGSYAELVQDPQVELVYVATPHSRHFEDIMLCLTHGKHVLCEKAFTANATQARRAIAYAREQGLYLSEAIWTRFMPLRFTLEQLLRDGCIGTVTSLTVNLGYDLRHVERLQKPELAGGALLDLGVYTIHFALMAFGTEICDVQSACVKNAYGVDQSNGILLTFSDGKLAVLHSNAAANTNRMGVIYGTQGRIECYNINNYEKLVVVPDQGTVQAYPAPTQISGYEYEVEAAVRAIRAHRLEPEEIPHAETVRVMELMDALRKDWGVSFPFEEA